MSRDYETVRVDDRGEGLLLLSLDRPDVANAMNTQMGRDLLAFFDAVNAKPAQHRCIVVTGAGGGVGSVAIAILGKLGYKVVGSSGRPGSRLT